LIGREQDSQEVTHLVTGSRLVTLIGGGGVGKTRLALQVAAGLEQEYPRRAVFVELAPLADPALLPSFVAAALGLREQEAPERQSSSTRPAVGQALIDWLSTEPTLLVLDNCEHLIEAAAALAHVLLEACPELRILATSRQRLELIGEIAWRVPSLPSPDPEELPEHASSAAEHVRQFPAAQLFVERATMARPGFRLVSRDDASAVARICRRLDGIPLALELAAARVSVLTPAQIAARLDDRFQLLTGGSRAALPRHQTLRALIDWSYDGLPEEEAHLLRWLSVFTGGWTLEAAEAVTCGEAGGACADFGFGILDFGLEADPTAIENPKSEIRNSGVLDLLASLEGRSLVLVEETTEGMRYRMMESVREYAREKLRACGEEEAARNAHTGYLLELAETAAAGIRGPEQLQCLNVLEAEQDNLRAAMAWCLESPSGGEAGLRLARAVDPFWLFRGSIREGRQYLDLLLSLPHAAGRTAARAAALDAAGSMAFHQRDYAVARARTEECLSIWEELGDQAGIAGALNLLSRLTPSREEARQLATRSLALFRECNQPAGIASVLTRLSAIAHGEQDHDAARAFLQEAVSIVHSMGDRTLEASHLSTLATIEYDRRDYAAARDHFQASLDLAREMGMHNQTAVSLYFLGLIAFQGSDFAAARSLWEECRAWDRRNGTKGGAVLHALAELAAVQEEYDAARAWWEESLAEGRELGRPDLIMRALRGLADTSRLQGDPIEALKWYAASLREVQAAGSRPENRIADEHHEAERAACMQGIAATISRIGREEQAARLLGAAEAIAAAVGSVRSARAQTDYDEQTAALRRTLGEANFTAAWAEGRAMSLEQAVNCALEVAQSG
jgi:non-specific serine/threonine protein kinase